MTAGNSNHDFDDELLSAYVDGELTAAERALVEERLRADPAAVALVEELRGLSAAVKSLPRETLGRDLRAAILAEASEARADLATHGPAPSNQPEPLPPHNHWQGIRRGLVWSAFAIAATLLISIFQPAEENRERGDLAKAERKLKSADRQREHSGAGQQVADGEEAAIDRLADADRIPPGLRGGMSSGPASVPAESSFESSGESLDLDGASASSGMLAGAPSSSIASAPAPPAASEPRFSAAARDSGRAEGVAGGEARPIDDAKIAHPMTVTLRTAGPGGAERLEQLLAESRLALDKAMEEPTGQLAHDAVTNGDRQAAAARIINGVIVEATPQQIEELLAKCRADQQTFAAVEVQSLPANHLYKSFAEGAFGGGGAGPPLIARDGKQLPWARKEYAARRGRELGDGQRGEEESVADAGLPADELAEFRKRTAAAPVDSPTPRIRVLFLLEPASPSASDPAKAAE